MIIHYRTEAIPDVIHVGFHTMLFHDFDSACFFS